MQISSSPFQLIESRKKRNFVIKLILYLTLLVAARSIPAYQELLDKFTGISSLHGAILFLLGGNILISLARISVVRFYMRKAKDERTHGNFLLGIAWISNILNSVIILISIMLAFDIQPLEFLTGLTIVAAAIAILTKDYFTNVINGLILMFTDQFSLGDTIKIGDQTGIIDDITLLNVVIKKDDGQRHIVPNNLILNTQVTNLGQLDHKNIEFVMDITHDKKLEVERLQELLEKRFEQAIKDGKILTIKPKLMEIQKDFSKIKVTLEVPMDQDPSVESQLQEFLLKLSHGGY
ncbi:mechanosensitive ion channel family protein [Mariniradius sediminis]|uniref:Mechanosensitive ion channel family protein n=1 Tax=Mariniradius sediminis TaxID=2909237 RepID=A0ABS9BPW8_9BACT|nr:mechanosensitive ion channel domain-containing protein [Mariniradius sediminis]MCF1749611.1 mechanosensitive ion channel family protein [Mariniradius sediminis]